MSSSDQHLDTLTEIRSMMERSSRFISLSGLSGVFAGIFALSGAAAAWVYLYFLGDKAYYEYATTPQGTANIPFYQFFGFTAALVLLLSVSVAYFLTRRNATKQGLPTWDRMAGRLVVNFMIPLVSGGFFCLILLKHGQVGLVAPATLIFYGMALLNASKYTHNDIRYLGICEIVLGLISGIFIGYGLLFWAIGFGVLHIIYGTSMYMKYERNK